jgi:hypothetical protein
VRATSSLEQCACSPGTVRRSTTQQHSPGLFQCSLLLQQLALGLGIDTIWIAAVVGP